MTDAALSRLESEVRSENEGIARNMSERSALLERSGNMLDIIEIAFTRLQRHARSVMTDADTALDYVAMTPARPEYRTRAEAEIERAKAALTYALSCVEQAEQRFAALPEVV